MKRMTVFLSCLLATLLLTASCGLGNRRTGLARRRSRCLDLAGEKHLQPGICLRIGRPGRQGHGDQTDGYGRDSMTEPYRCVEHDLHPLLIAY